MRAFISYSRHDDAIPRLRRLKAVPTDGKPISERDDPKTAYLAAKDETSQP